MMPSGLRLWLLALVGLLLLIYGAWPLPLTRYLIVLGAACGLMLVARMDERERWVRRIRSMGESR